MSASLETFPLTPINNQHTRRLAARGFTVLRGANEEVAEALHAGISDPVITEFTRDTGRFSSLRKTREWLADPEKGRVPYSLFDSAIVGIIWFGSAVSPHSTAEYDFAIRMYELGRDRGLAGDFLEAAHEDFVEDQGGDDTWLRVQRKNEIAKQMYLRHGYTIDRQTPKLVYMTRKAKT